jgi:hypothetical protein
VARKGAAALTFADVLEEMTELLKKGKILWRNICVCTCCLFIADIFRPLCRHGAAFIRLVPLMLMKRYSVLAWCEEQYWQLEEYAAVTLLTLGGMILYRKLKVRWTGTAISTKGCSA